MLSTIKKTPQGSGTEGWLGVGATPSGRTGRESLSTELALELGLEERQGLGQAEIWME